MPCNTSTSSNEPWSHARQLSPHVQHPFSSSHSRALNSFEQQSVKGGRPGRVRLCCIRKKNTHSEPAIGQHGRWLTGIEDGRETSDTWTGDQGNWSRDGDCTGVTLARVSGSTKVEESNHLVIPWKKIVFGIIDALVDGSSSTHSSYTYMDLSYLTYKYMATHKLTATLMLKHENNKNFFLFSVSQRPVDSSHQLFLLTRGSKYSLLGLQKRLRYI